jgi:hypothetical protein
MRWVEEHDTEKLNRATRRMVEDFMIDLHAVSG